MAIETLNTVYQLGLREKVKKYRKVAALLRKRLARNPGGWGQYQGDVNRELNSIFMEIMNFERERLAVGDEVSVYKLKRLFVERLRNDFLYGDLPRWCIQQPFGYAGDFKLIDDVYVNSPVTRGFDRLFDNYALMTAVAVAIRNRKDDLKKMLKSFMASARKPCIHIMNLACGSARELKELIDEGVLSEDRSVIDCYDRELRALEFARNLFGERGAFVNFISENAMMLALRNMDQNDQHLKRYDFIYSLGLFDYLDERIASRLVRNLKKMLTADGRLMIANVREKYQNPSVFFLEWVGDWNLIYRSEKDFVKIFLNAGFRRNQLEVISEQQGIVQYVMAHARGALSPR